MDRVMPLDQADHTINQLLLLCAQHRFEDSHPVCFVENYFKINGFIRAALSYPWTRSLLLSALRSAVAAVLSQTPSLSQFSVFKAQFKAQYEISPEDWDALCQFNQPNTSFLTEKAPFGVMECEYIYHRLLYTQNLIASKSP